MTTLTADPLPARTTGAQPSYEYDAFISYSHAADGALAPAIQRALHRFARPWYRLRALRVYRDETNLSAAPELWSAIQNALARSRFFLLMLSPAAAASKWVDAEVRWWLANRSIDSIILLLSDGTLVWNDTEGDFAPELSSALPPALEKKFRAEPKYVDFTWARAEQGLTLSHPRFLERVLDIAAPLHRRDRDSLAGEDVRQHRRTRLVATLAAAAILAGAVAAVSFALIARTQRNLARQQARVALARQLAAESQLLLTQTPGALEASVGLAEQAAWRDSSSETSAVLWRALTLLPRRIAAIEHRGAVSKVVFLGGREALASAGLDSTVRFTRVDTFPRPATIVRRLASGVYDLALHPSKAILAAGCEDGTIALLDASDGHILRTTHAHRRMARHLAFSPDGRVLASAGGDSTTRIWDVETLTLLDSVRHRAIGWGIAFSHDGRYLAAGGRDGIIHVLSTRPWREIATFRAGNTTWSLAFSPDTKLLVIAGGDSLAALWRVAEHNTSVLKIPHDSVVQAVAFSPDGKTLATSTWSGIVRLWDMPAVTERRRMLSAGIVTGLTFSPDGRFLASTGDMSRIWDVATGAEVNRMVEEGQTHTLAFASSGDLLATGDMRGVARVWEVAPETQELLSVRDRASTRTNPVLNRGWAVATDPVGEILIAGSPDSGATLWQLATAHLLTRLPHSGPVTLVAAARQYFATGGPSGEARVWNARGGLATTVRHGAPLLAMAMNSTATQLVTAGSDHVVILWSLPDGHQRARRQLTFEDDVAVLRVPDNGQRILLATPRRLALWHIDADSLELLSGPARDLRSLAFSPDGAFVGATDASDTTSIWSVDQGALIGRFAGAGDPESLAIDNDGRRAVTVQYRARVAELRSVATSSPLRRFVLDTFVNTVAVARTSGAVATGAQGGVVRVWSMATGRELARILNNGAWSVESVAFAGPDDKYLLIGHVDGLTSVWLWRTADALRIACTRMSTGLTLQAWRLRTDQPFEDSCPRRRAIASPLNE